MSPRLGLRSRILALTMPVVLLVSAGIAGIVYFSLGQMLEVSALDIAQAEVLELKADLALHSLPDMRSTHDIDVGTRASQVVDSAGRVVVTTDSRATSPLVAPTVAAGALHLEIIDSIRSLDGGSYAVAVADATGRDGLRYSAIVAVPTRVESTALVRSMEFAIIGAIGLVAVLAAVTTFAVGQALRPVERMRDQVEDIAASRPAPILEVPAGRDELTKLGETMNHVLAQLQRADDSRRSFVADAGHELRSPLTTIRVLVDRLGEDPPAEERRQAAARAAAEVERLSVLVDDLLALAAADEHVMALRVSEVDLDDVVLSETGALRARGMPVSVTVEPVRVVGDAHRLGRVVRNLLENAERHREHATRLTLSHDRAFAVLEVDNDGPPVALDDRQRIFGRFVRLDDSRTRDTGGTGLGLAIVSEIVRAHGGTVVADESPDGWCRFSVRLPLDRRSG